MLVQRVCKEGSASKCSNEIFTSGSMKNVSDQENGFKSMTKLLRIAVADANPLATVKFPSSRQWKTCVRVHTFLVAQIVSPDFLIDQVKEEIAVSEKWGMVYSLFTDLYKSLHSVMQIK